MVLTNLLSKREIQGLIKEEIKPLKEFIINEIHYLRKNINLNKEEFDFKIKVLEKEKEMELENIK